MKYYSTNQVAPHATLEEAVVRGLAPDKGLYMPEIIKQLPKDFFDHIETLSFQEIAYRVADAFFGDDVEPDALKQIVYDTLAFDAPVVKVEDNIYSLELFHGPTLAFKDVGARFMARLLQHFIKKEAGGQTVNVLVATSGDTGSAVANGFLGVDGIHVYVLYPKGKVSKIQECQFTTLGQNITAIEIDGVFDDCQALVKSAFMDEELNRHIKLTSANSINVARFGNEMGLPVKRFIAANNANDIFYQYLKSGKYEPKPSKQTIANAMDVGNPSNFARIYDLFGGSHERITSRISGATYTDAQIMETMRQCHKDTGYTLDPHGACGYRALKELLQPGETGVFLETAHPAKFKEKVDAILNGNIQIPERLANFMRGRKQSIEMSKDFNDFKDFLMKV